ncbi:phage tail protein [Haematospirillum jordaniae]|uniref:phage tail protein n=1 Tax=Haematospirillum jordaniae TaxID=1549855 RepID=UPI001FD7B567|nr:phage tail protein [Haematospirillum jordaniae]
MPLWLPPSSFDAMAEALMTYQEVTITDAGRRAIINATGTNPVKITRAALGSEQYTPDPSQTRLRSVAPKYLSSLSGEVVNGDTIHLTITDASDDAYRVAELGLFTEDDILLAVYSQPDGAFMEKAAGSTLLLSVDIALHSLSTTSISFGDTRFSNPPASETVKGVVLLASPEDVESGTDTTKAVTPSGLKKALDAKAFALATALKPADILDASEAHKGLVELATTAEAMAGTDATRAVTPAGLRRTVDDKAATVKADLEQAFAAADATLKAQIENTITQTAKNIKEEVGAATENTLGIVRLATADEIKAGTNTEKAVTPAALAQAFPAPVGSVIMHAGQTPPLSYLVCNGQTLSRTDYAQLFAVIGTTFGSGDGSTTFTLPDLRGEFLRGWDDGRGADPGRTFGSNQADAFKSHRHVSMGRSFNQGAFYTTVGGYGMWPNGNVDPNHYRTSSEGGSETRPRNVALLPCIRYQ